MHHDGPSRAGPEQHPICSCSSETRAALGRMQLEGGRLTGSTLIICIARAADERQTCDKALYCGAWPALENARGVDEASCSTSRSDGEHREELVKVLVFPRAGPRGASA